MDRVHVLATGGTIASTGDEAGATPTRSGADLVEAVPGLDDVADVTVEEVAQSPGFDVDPGIVTAVRERAAAAVRDGATGVVVTHGTDTLAETAYLLDATLPDGVPAVVTGAQRRPDEPGADGPANLLAAVRVAADSRVSDGAFVAFGGELHDGRSVVKAHSRRPNAFESPDVGPVAAVGRDRIRFRRAPRRESVRLPAADDLAAVDIVTSAAGVGRGPVDRAVEAGVDGLVIAGTGLGNATAALGRAAADAVEAGVEVVAATRCYAGGVGAVYGTAGGAHTLADRGVRSAGRLSPPKARLKLATVLAGDPDAVEDYFPSW